MRSLVFTVVLAMKAGENQRTEQTRKTSATPKSVPVRLESPQGFARSFLVVFFLMVIVGSKLAHAQSGVVSGRITDVSGASVPNAAVEIQNSATGVKWTATTNSDGYYQSPPVEPDVYTLQVNVAGFSPATVTGIHLEVGGAPSINLVLQLAKAEESVIVSAGAPELVVDHPDRGNVIESKFVQNMPLNIRNPLQMVNFAQGVTAYSLDSGNNDASEAYTNTFRINGGRLATTESLLDGGVNTTLYDFNAIASVPQVDSIQEFKVLTTAYAPEWGRTSGGVVTFATKSGTDRLHGSIFEYIRNSATDANSFNANLAGQAKPHFERNQFGYALGGPVAFPPHYRDKGHRTFFYSTYEGLRQSQAGNFTYTVPTALERQGDFSQSFDAKGNLIVIFDPSSTMLQPAGSVNPACGVTSPVPAGTTVYCRTPFPGNKIPNLDAAGKAMINSYPLPNQHGQGQSSVNNYFSNAPTSSIQNTINFRIDHRFSDKHSIFSHFDWFQRYNYFGDPYKNNLSPTSNHQRLPGINVMLDHTWILTPNIIFEHHFVYAHQESNRIPETLGYDPTKLGFNSNVSAGLPSTTFPEIKAASRLSPLGPQSGLENDGGTTLEYAASLIQLKGKHSLKYGFDYRALSLDYHVNQLVSLTGSSNFTGGPNVGLLSGETDSGSGIADLLLGTGTVTSGIVPGFRVMRPYYAFYAQDEYHLTPKLTLNYGLRYSIELPDIEKHNQFQFIDLTSPSPLNSQVTSLGALTGGPGFAGTNGVGPRLQNALYKNFDPRIGFAYQWNQKTVVRAGFGIFHAPGFLILGSATSQGYSAVTISNPAEANGVTPLFNMASPFPSGLTQPSGNSLGLNTNAGLSITGYPRQQSISYSEQWSLDVQRELPYHFVVTAGYVGNNGLHLYVPLNYNQLPDSDLAMGSALIATVPNPFYGVITNQTSPLSAKTVRAFQLLLPHPQFQSMTADLVGSGQSSYNALQLSVEHRFSQGLALLFAYTHSKILDNVGDFFNSNNFQDNYCPACDRSISQQDLANVIRLSGQYELPFGRGKPYANRGVLAETVGGWSAGSFFTYDDGLPAPVTATANSTNSTNVFGGGSVIRPNVVSGVSTNVPGGRHITVGGPPGTVSEYFNPAAFTATPPYQFGTAPRYLDTVRLPGTANFDMLAEKLIPIKESIALNFRVEFFNAFNHVQFAAPNTNYSTAPETFGYISPNQLNSARSIQASLRLSF